MGKPKTAEYIAEGLRRARIRKDKRKEQRASKKERASKYYCRGCGEDPYCYCGDGTPYSY